MKHAILPCTRCGVMPYKGSRRNITCPKCGLSITATGDRAVCEIWNSIMRQRKKEKVSFNPSAISRTFRSEDEQIVSRQYSFRDTCNEYDQGLGESNGAWDVSGYSAYRLGY